MEKNLIDKIQRNICFLYWDEVFLFCQKVELLNKYTNMYIRIEFSTYFDERGASEYLNVYLAFSIKTSDYAIKNCR